MTQPPTVAVYGGSFDPPGSHHRDIAGRLTEMFDRVVIVPCGPRPDNPATNDTAPIHRAILTDLTFQGLPRVRVELFDLEAATFTRTHELEERFRADGEVWHVVAASFVHGGRHGRSVIQTGWQRGAELWERARFVVLVPRGEALDRADLPPAHRLLAVEPWLPSAAIRGRVFNHQPIDGLVEPAVARYVQRHGLFRGVPAAREGRFRLGSRRCRIVADKNNPRARALEEKLRPLEHASPDLIVVLGGDGTMLHAIRDHWRDRLPFYGINVGHLGFLLNNDWGLDFWDDELLLYQLPLLRVEAEEIEGGVQSRLAFNDAWVERASGQTAWVRVTINGEERLPKVVGDGVLVASAAGSTCYARAVGGVPVPFNTPVLLLAGSNVLSPAFWKSAVLPVDSRIELTTLDPVKRPLQGYVDGVPLGGVKSLRVRVSNIAAADLAFGRAHDPAEKLAQIQFPRIDP